jgi:hypothetical protein
MAITDVRLPFRSIDADRVMAVENSLVIRVVDSYAVSTVSSAWLAPHPHSEAVAEAPQMPAGLNNREYDVWLPLIEIATYAGPEWQKRITEACVAMAREARVGVQVAMTSVRDEGSRKSGLS